MAEKAFITPEVLKWARETAKISIEEAALKIPACTKAKLTSWESGDEYPTIRQAEKLAKIYRRPFSALFLPSVPK
ncbi:MAG: helix-turn-helix transcriptional regulator, partial [bacterium]